MKPDKDKTQKLCLRQQTQICGVNILSGGNRKWVSYTRFEITHRRRTANRHMGTAASGLSEAVPQGYIHQSSHKRFKLL